MDAAMRFDVITLFPEIFKPFLEAGVTRRAYESGLVDVKLHDLRDHALGNYHRVDDRPFGGGPGMVMMAEPLAACLASVRSTREQAGPVVLFSPTGQALDQAGVVRWSRSQGAILICGRYEGVDQRFIDAHVDEQVSLGDFVLSGGEVAAMALLDAVARLQDGVLNAQASHQLDSFSVDLDGLLDCPHYTRPDSWSGMGVPEVLLSGHHLQIERWRRDQRLLISARLRPDLIALARAAGRLDAADEATLSKVQAMVPNR